MRIRVAAAVVFVLALPACARTQAVGPRPTSSPTRRPDRPILFTSLRDGYYRIYATDATGAGPTRVIDIVSHEDGPQSAMLDYIGQPSWAPSRAQFAFTCTGEQSDICIANADGTGVRLLGRSHPRNYPDWSPDGTKIAFSEFGKNRPSRLAVLDLATGDVRYLTDGHPTAAIPDWSPDGTQLLFNHIHRRTFEIYMVNADGTGLRNLTRTPKVKEAFPEWSPDGKVIAFVTRVNSDIWVMNPDGTGRRNLTRTKHNLEAYPSWSPDGTQIAYMGTGPGPHNADIFVMNADGTDRHRITDNPLLDMQPEW